MTELLLVVAGAIFGAIFAPLVPVLRPLYMRFYRRYGPNPRANDLFDVEFLNDQGHNIFAKNDDPKLQASDPSWFRVVVNFNLHVKETAVLTNIELGYPDVESAWPGPQVIKIDGTQQETDGRFGLAVHRQLEPGTVLRVRLNREFRCNAEKTWDGDYKRVTITLEFTTPISGGFHRLVVSGVLKAGGQVSDKEMQLEEA